MIMTKRHLCVFGAMLATIALLAGCAGQTTKSTPPALVCPKGEGVANPDGACAQAIGRLVNQAFSEAAGPGWGLQGRVAISTGKQSGNARIDWQQSPVPGSYEVTLSAPVTRQSWRLQVDQGRATLSGLDGGDRTGPDAGLLLREAVGWDIPIASLRFWMRGLPVEGDAAQYAFDARQQLIGLDQYGWHIQFERTGEEALPKRITASRGDSRVRLVIDQWGAAAGE